MKNEGKIEYLGDGKTIVYKYPGTVFNTDSWLIVHPNQQVLLCREEQALDLFKEGRYTLHPSTIPKLSCCTGLFSDEVMPFHCDIWFFNIAEPMDISWEINTFDFSLPHCFNLSIQVSINGRVMIRIIEPRKFFTLYKRQFEENQSAIEDYCREIIQCAVRSEFCSALYKHGTVFIETESMTSDFVKETRHRISKSMHENWGVEIVQLDFDANIKSDAPQIKIWEKIDGLFYERIIQPLSKQNYKLCATDTIDVNARLIRKMTGEEIMVNKPVFRIGRGHNHVDYSVSSNGAISRNHADIITRNGRAFIKDLNSKNMTYINGCMLVPDVETELSHGDIIKLANEEFSFLEPLPTMRN